MLILNWSVGVALTIFISGGLLGWGTFLSARLRATPGSPIIGIGVLCWLMLVTGSLGLYTAVPQFALILAGWFLLFTYRTQLPRLAKALAITRPHGRDWIWFVFPALYILTRFFSDGLPQQHSDPLYYHLAAPKIWAMNGKIALSPDHPSFAQATLWELLYGLPQLWLPASLKNVTGQLVAQWLHFIWGQLGCALIASALLERVTPGKAPSFAIRFFVGWLCACTPALEWTGALAKNDYIFCLFLLTAVLETRDKRYGLAGLLMGLAYSTKMFAFWTGLALFALIPLRSWGIYAAGGLAAILPIILRNLYFTGNPVFPALDLQLGPGWTSHAWNVANNTFAGAPTFAGMGDWMARRLFYKPLPLALLAAALIGYAARCARVRRLELKRELVFVGIQFSLALSILKPMAEGRYAAPILMMLTIYGLGQFFDWWRPKNKWALTPLLAAGFLVNSPVDVLVKIPRDYLFKPATAYVEQFHPIFKLHDWVNKNIPRDKTILFADEKQNYYLDRDFVATSESRKWETLFNSTSSGDELLRKIRATGYDYFHFYRDVWAAPAINDLRKNAEKYKEKAVLMNGTSVILKLDSI